MSNCLDLTRFVGRDLLGTASATAILFRVTVLLLAAVPVALLLRRASASLRHLVWAISLVGVLLIPLCYCTLPGWQWAVLPPLAPATNAIRLDDPFSSMSARDMPVNQSSEPLNLSLVSSQLRSDKFVAKTLAPASRWTLANWSWTEWLGAIWAAGSLLGFAWLGVGVVGAWHVARHAKPIADWHGRQMLRRLCDAYGIRRPVEVRLCHQVSVPMTWGLRRPMILLPIGSMAWSEAVLRSVLMHELGHVRRGDCLVHLLARLACAAYWFHPLVWLAAKQLRKTSEQAADDAVLSSNVAPPDYAQHLIGIAAHLRGINLFGHVALPMASHSDLEGRVLAILDSRRDHGSLKRKTCFALLLLATLLFIPCALVRLGYAEEEKGGVDESATAQTSPANGAATNKEEPSLPDENGTPAEDKRGTRYRSGGKLSAEHAVGNALDWLHHHQASDGHWSLDFRERCKDDSCADPGKESSDTEATAMALLPFLAAGQTHKTKGHYQESIGKAIDWLIKQQDANGNLSGKCEHPMTAHGIATVTLCNAFGMTRDENVGAAAKKAVDYIEREQDASTGGWHPSPKEACNTDEFGWQVMALKSAQRAGLKVSPAVSENAKKWLRSVATGEHHGLFSDRPQQESTPVATAIGVLCSQYLGVGRNDPAMSEGVQYLMKNLPDNASRNTELWYTATLALHNVGGPEGDTWVRKLRQILAESQVNTKNYCAIGSWDPAEPSIDIAADKGGGRLATTCLSALALEVYYRYLPLYYPDTETGSTGSDGTPSRTKEESENKGKHADATKSAAVSGKAFDSEGRVQASAPVKVITDLDQIAVKLAQIRDIAARHEKKFENLRVQGKFLPNDEAFSLVIRDGKCRHDREVVRADGQRVTSHWLDDGTTSFAFSENLLNMAPTNGGGQEFANSLAIQFWLYLTPPGNLLGNEHRTVSQYCDVILHHIDVLRSAASYVKLEIKETGPQTQIEIVASNVGAPAEVHDRATLTLDSTKNYVMTDDSQWSSAMEGPEVFLSETKTHSEYREIAPGVFFLSKGNWWSKRSGTRLEAVGQTYEGKLGITINSVEIGDFPVEQDYFDVHHWPPIKLGIKVYDNRVKPPLQYVYDKGSFDDAVLKQ